MSDPTRHMVNTQVLLWGIAAVIYIVMSGGLTPSEVLRLVLCVSIVVGLSQYFTRPKLTERTARPTAPATGEPRPPSSSSPAPPAP